MAGFTSLPLFVALFLSHPARYARKLLATLCLTVFLFVAKERELASFCLLLSLRLCLYREFTCILMGLNGFCAHDEIS